ncbi:hypothetical protein K501DRAFT_324081 [Backusella circina FSU 941]|nr:hypothetical protein K501DRAFT_324081 [Backusella circina FSU 941]
MKRTCLWIIPIRVGVFIISLLITVVSAALIAATFLHRNPMMIHLSIVHTVLPWMYIAALGVSGVIGLFGIMATITDNHGVMVLYRTLFWLMTVFIVYVWQITLFVLALVNRSKTIVNACHDDTTASSNAIFGLESGDVYGLANCHQAVEAGMIGLGTMLFIGGIYTTWFAMTIHRYTQQLSRVTTPNRTSHWDDNLDQLHSAYARDKIHAKYPLKDLSQQHKFSRGLVKMKAKR